MGFVWDPTAIQPSSHLAVSVERPLTGPVEVLALSRILSRIFANSYVGINTELEEIP